MDKEHLEEYREYIKMKYDNLLLLQEGRGISMGELAYFDDMPLEKLQELETEIDNETYIAEQMEKED